MLWSEVWRRECAARREKAEAEEKKRVENRKKELEEKKEQDQLPAPKGKVLADGRLQERLYYNQESLPVYVAKRTGRSHGYPEHCPKGVRLFAYWEDLPYATQVAYSAVPSAGWAAGGSGTNTRLVRRTLTPWQVPPGEYLLPKAKRAQEREERIANARLLGRSESELSLPDLL